MITTDGKINETEILWDLMSEFVRRRTTTDAPTRLGRVFAYHPTGPALTEKGRYNQLSGTKKNGMEMELTCKFGPRSPQAAVGKRSCVSDSNDKRC